MLITRQSIRKVDFTQEIAWFKILNEYRKSVHARYTVERIENIVDNYITTLILQDQGGNVTLYYLSTVWTEGNVTHRVYDNLQSALDCYHAVKNEPNDAELIPDCIATITRRLATTTESALPMELLEDYIQRNHVSFPCDEQGMPL